MVLLSLFLPFLQNLSLILVVHHQEHQEFSKGFTNIVCSGYRSFILGSSSIIIILSYFFLFLTNSNAFRTPYSFKLFLHFDIDHTNANFPPTNFLRRSAMGLTYNLLPADQIAISNPKFLKKANNAM